MEPEKRLTPGFFFLSLGSLAALIASVTAFLNLSFEILNRTFPDVLTDTYTYGYMSGNFESMRSALALLIIIFPVFLVLEYFNQKVFNKEQTRWNIILRKWITFLVLFLASVTIITDLVVLVRYFVSGEITARFILKVLATLIVAGIVGWYFLRKLAVFADKKAKVFAIVGAILVLGVIIWSFIVLGAPGSQRKLRLDQRRVQDLQSIQSQVIYYWQQTKSLPKDLKELATPISSYMVPQDPEFMKGKTYEYQVTGDKSFTLCATYDLPMPKGYLPENTSVARPAMGASLYGGPDMYYGETNSNWDHEAGRTCYARTIDERLYPPFDNKKLD